MSLEFNPMTEIFEQPDRDLHPDKAAEFDELARADIHNTNLYDEEGLAHGGEAIDPETGRPNVSMHGESTNDSHISERERQLGHSDMMGDVKDPSKMSLEELLATQEKEI